MTPEKNRAAAFALLTSHIELLVTVHQSTTECFATQYPEAAQVVKTAHAKFVTEIRGLLAHYERPDDEPYFEPLIGLLWFLGAMPRQGLEQSEVDYALVTRIHQRLGLPPIPTERN